MGTLFHYDRHLPLSADDKSDTRQCEVFTSSGEHDIYLRLGEINEQHMGRGFQVHVNEHDARELVEGLLNAMRYIGYKTDDLIG
jgi:hypothetical protein